MAIHIYTYQLVLQFMLLCNVTILFKIRRMRAHVTSSGTAHNYTPHKSKTTCMLLIVSFTYIVTLLPMVLLSMIIHVSMRTNPSLARFMLHYFNDIRYVLELISEINYGANFYIYVMSGAQFRCQLGHICSPRSTSGFSGHSGEIIVYFRKSDGRRS